MPKTGMTRAPDEQQSRPLLRDAHSLADWTEDDIEAWAAQAGASHAGLETLRTNGLSGRGLVYLVDFLSKSGVEEPGRSSFVKSALEQYELRVDDTLVLAGALEKMATERKNGKAKKGSRHERGRGQSRGTNSAISQQSEYTHNPMTRKPDGFQPVGLDDDGNEEVFSNPGVLGLELELEPEKGAQPTWLMDAISYFSFFGIGLLLARIAIWDSLVSFQQDIHIYRAGSYVLTLLLFMMAFPYMCANLMHLLMVALGTTQLALVVVLMVWSFFMIMVYLAVRTIAGRCTKHYTTIPVLVLPVSLIGDLFSEMVFLDFSIDQPAFWLVLIFDIFMLVMRDADLWDDFASWFARKSGRIGALALVFAQLIAGETDSADWIFNRQKYDEQAAMQPTSSHFAYRAPTATEVARVKRELTENCVVSELVSSSVLFVLILVDIILEKSGVPGATAFASGRDPPMTSRQRSEGLVVYSVIFLFQLLGIAISGQIVKYKNAIAVKWQKMRDAAQSAEMRLPSGCSWNFFLSHSQASGGDQAYSLYLELDQQGYRVWYDNRAGSAYEDYHAKYSKIKKQQRKKGRAERRVSVISPESLFFGKNFWYRVMLCILAVYGSIWSSISISCILQDRYGPAGCIQDYKNGTGTAA
eukprot:g2120.t1